MVAKPSPLRLDTSLLDYKPDAFSNGGLPVTPPADYELEVLHELSTPVDEVIDPQARPLVAVIGVGYVGTHLVNNFGRVHDTIGFDVSERRVKELQHEFSQNSRVRVTSNASDLDEATHYLISVPTLLLADRSIDASYLRSALRTVAAHARRGATVVIESSVAVGMTRQLLGPLAKRHGYFAGMSPERVDPGRIDPPAHAIPKVVSGLDDVVPGSLNSILALYSQAFDRVVPVSTPEVAEMTKLYENCQRMMCIAYANEMADACQPHGIDPFEVCSAAATKPFGYQDYTPGVGVGGHCIPVNPHYLLSNSAFPLLQAASDAMARRPAALARRAVDKLLRRWPANAVCKPRVLVVGVGFKAGQATLSNSPGLDLIKHLCLSSSVDVGFADPLVSQDHVPQVPRLDDDAWNAETLKSFDMIIVTMRQHGLDFGLLDNLDGVEVEFWCK
ncbi:hypothetical protein CDD82_1870 [Ophiocordyceps australis]|uniref:UDP-glucose/GDP-mannose dehydrogenase C-terminal domain-containing protein n=1 Tax=Ophiocordyceps australis TaxID=1399860 RepID=A0A2C5ZQI7_9HYPO|nr:hypothetical protein CDD82_1870 [Ophiocordyceps australis]